MAFIDAGKFPASPIARTKRAKINSVTLNETIAPTIANSGDNVFRFGETPGPLTCKKSGSSNSAKSVKHSSERPNADRPQKSLFLYQANPPIYLQKA
jgi:hypothetical protein